MNYNNSKGQLTYQIEVDKQQKNGFPIPCTTKGTGKLGVLYPTQALEVTYGDTIGNRDVAGLQFNPLAVPIMANMYVKQEAYYTPFNCVWENWDNFISGGEDLDFTTPPPVITMRALLARLKGMFSLGLEYQYALQTDPDAHVLMVEIPANYGDLLGQLDLNCKGFFANYGMEDLYAHFIRKAVEPLEKWFESKRVLIADIKRANNGTLLSGWITKDIYIDILDGRRYVLLGAPMDMGVIISDGNIDNQNVVTPIFPADIDTTDKYYKLFGSSLDVYANTLGMPDFFLPTSGFRFTSTGYEFLNLMFKPYKPFIGVGSYIDYLNMDRITDEQFVYLFYCGFLEHYKNNNEFGLSMEMVSELSLRALELRALYLIWYNNYRDQLLETRAMKPKRTDYISGDEMIILTIPRVRCWEKDSYTTALDNPATADAVVPILNDRYVSVNYQEVKGAAEKEVDRNNLDFYKINFADGTTFELPTGFISGINAKDPANIDRNNNFFSLHVLDAVKRAQKFFRKALFYGNRIQDFIYVNFSVSHLDARLRLPEILCSSTAVAELQTLVNNTTVVTEQSSTVAGDRAGFAKAYDKGNYFNRFCEESGVIISIFGVIPEPTYAYGQSRQYSKLDRFDYPFPDFATLGMDAVYENELAAMPCKVALNGEMSDKPLVFGYQGRYYDKKFRQSTEHGELLTTQDMYTFGRKWNMFDPEQRPRLNAEFVHCFPPLDMFVMEDETEDYFRFDIYHDTTAELQLPYHSIYM